MRMSKVVIVLEGGLVQSVYTDDDKVQVAVLDYDVFEDVDPKLDLDNFFSPMLDPKFEILKNWQKRKSELLAILSRPDEG
jgi:hypothetical protein